MEFYLFFCKRLINLKQNVETEVRSMQLVWTIIWSFLLSSMVTYVVSSMQGGEFAWSLVLVSTIAFTVAVVVLGEGALKEEAE